MKPILVLRSVMIILVTIYPFLQENILSNVILIEMNLSKGGKILNSFDKIHAGQVVFNLETFHHHWQIYHLDFFGKQAGAELGQAQLKLRLDFNEIQFTFGFYLFD